jgi:L-fuconolactonase
MEAAAAHPNVYTKLSDLFSTEDLSSDKNKNGRCWSMDAVKPYTDHVIKVFGTSRVMFGSNWPVCKAAHAELDDCVADFKKLVAEFSREDQEKMAAGNGRDFYGLKIR